jgi:hypothetical protein
MQTDGRTDMMEAVDVYRENVNALKNHLIAVAMNGMHKCQNLNLLSYLNFGL